MKKILLSTILSAPLLFAPTANAGMMLQDFDETEGKALAKTVALAVLHRQTAANNPEIAALLARKDALTNNPSPEAQNALQAVSNELANRSEFLEFKTSADNQEILKQHVDGINKMNESGDDQLVATAQTKLTELRTRLSMYLVDSSKITTAKGLPAVQASDTAITSGMLASNLVNAVIIDNRLGGFVGNGGIASGDIFQKYGAWVKGTYTNGQQKTFKLEPGYKFDQKGVTIGADTGDDESTIGIAYSFFKNDIKNKINSSNKEDITSHIWSIYGLYAFDQNFFISGHGQCGSSTTKKKRATGDAANNIANAKPKGNIISGKATIGYIYDTGANINLIPTLGIAYNDVKVKGYKETGNGLNRTVGKRSATRTSGLAGISAKYNADMNESTKIVPEIHANIDYAFNTKHSSTAITILNGLDPIVTPAAKLSKAHYTVGASVMVTSSEKFDITGGYDLGLSKKFMSHTGTVKVRINF